MHVLKLIPEILFETEGWLAINKPAGLLSIPDREGKEVSVKIWLKEKYGTIYTVHRLDRETSGLIIFAKTESAHRYLSQIFEDRSVDKIYLGLVQGILSEKQGTIDAPIMEHPARNGMMMVHQKGKPSATEYLVLEELGKFSFLQFRILTGRTHQIRVHMKHMGHPILCDSLYGDGAPVMVSSFKRNYKLSRNDEEEKPILKRLALHAYQLRFTGPEGESVNLEAPLPRDLHALLNQLRKVGGK